MERLDKLLAGTGKWSRREVKALVRQGLVRVDGRLAASAEDKLDPAAAIITVAGETISLRRHADRTGPSLCRLCGTADTALHIPHHQLSRNGWGRAGQPVPVR